jgi:hypothetical protein
MSENLFLKPEEYYQRKINPLAQYVEQTGFYLSKMTGQDVTVCRQRVRDGIKARAFPQQTDPIVTYFERDDNQDRTKEQIRLSQYIGQVVANEEILVPTFTSYLPTKVRKSILVGFIDNNVKLRSAAKKAAFVAEAEKRTDDYIMLNNEQTNRKLYNNSMSGAFAAGGSIVNNPTGHNTLTSMTRTVSSMGNSSNEKIIMGNRHYHSPDVTLFNIISITNGLVREELEPVMQKYGLVYPTVQQTLDCITYSSDLYWKDIKAFKKIQDFVEHLDPLERAAFVYCGDFFHIRKYNEDFTRKFLGTLMSKVKGVPVEEPLKRIHQFDEQIVNYAHQICMKELRGAGKAYEKLPIEDLYTLIATCQNIEDFVIRHKDFINAIFLTDNVPGSTAYITNMIRRTVVLSDTDSTMFAIDDWVIWHRGQLVFDDEAYALAGAMMFIATQCIAHCLAIFSANMGVERKKLFMLAMKPEYVFPLHCQTSVAKHYFASMAVKEGNVYPEHKSEIKGVGLKNSAAPKDLIKDSQAKMVEIMKIIHDGGKISLVNELTRVANIERKIRDSLLDGNVEYYKQSKIKDAEAYARSATESPYMYHMFWETVFAPKYNSMAAPPYSVIKIPLMTDNPTKLSNWINGIADKELSKRLLDFLVQHKKKALGTFYISSQYVKSFGIPEEFKPVINVKKIALDLTSQDRMVLETLGFYPKVDWLISEQGY